MYKNSEKEIRSILQNYKHIAVVGISQNAYRASNGVSLYMINSGYNIIPVNPNYDQVFDLKCYNLLSEIEGDVEIVNIFRRSEMVLPIVEEAIKIKAKAVWMQLGVINEEAASLALDAGLKVVMNSCIKIEHARYL
ncbi:MAG: CoA-binding protein [Calditrichaeota bacterium]|nr:MAG: CoA-binding protein [Calditrichota bacterium]MBL1205871.1 CoA-binding protein [Calditrichota bacterium]NOG45699.1 CoA-binding protein [Calditrichota bacterium]